MYVYKSTAESRVTNAVLRAISLATQDRAVAERRKAPVSACKPLCAILLAKASVYPLSPVKTNVSRLCECDLKPLRRGLSHTVWDVASADWAVIGGTYL